MDDVGKVLEVWNSSLCKKVDLGGLISRNPTAHREEDFHALDPGLIGEIYREVAFDDAAIDALFATL